jgi:hypothetical protein
VGESPKPPASPGTAAIGAEPTAIRTEALAGISYEAAIPWSELTYETDRVQEELKLKFSLLVNDNDGECRRGWIEYNSGIRTAKDINAFGDLFLAD